jgi:hypothetical protein
MGGGGYLAHKLEQSRETGALVFQKFIRNNSKKTKNVRDPSLGIKMSDFNISVNSLPIGLIFLLLIVLVGSSPPCSLSGLDSCPSCFFSCIMHHSSDQIKFLLIVILQLILFA